MLLSELNTFDNLLEQKNVFVIPFGALEQHGRYAPIGSDNYIQDALLVEVQKAMPDVIFLPTIPIGPSWQHQGFQGTVSLRPTTLYAMIQDIVECLKNQAHLIVFISWHGGNKPSIAEFIDKEQSKYPNTKLKQVTFGDEGTDDAVEKLLAGPLDDHAGNTEVSLMLAVRPDITKQPSASDTKRHIDFSWDKHIIDVQPDGEIDSHSKWVASGDIGRELIQIYSKNLTAKIDDLLKR